MSAQENPNQKLQEVIVKTEDVKQKMRDNIAKSIQRGETLEILDDKSLHLEQETNRFRKSAIQAKRQQCLSSLKMYLLAAIIIAVLIVIILAISGVFS